MDVIWKELSDNHPDCTRLTLYNELDPGTGATFAVQCHSIVGVTSEENFANDAMYLAQGILPDNTSIQQVELNWAFVQGLEAEEDRETLLEGIASLRSLQSVRIQKHHEIVVVDEEENDEIERVELASLTVLPATAFQTLKHLSIEVPELVVKEQLELQVFASHLSRCALLESIHLRGFESLESSGDLDYNALIASLAQLYSLRTIHLSRKEERSYSVHASNIAGLCALPALESLSLMNMGLEDDHCTVLEECLKETTRLHTLVLIDNPGITEVGNASLLRLLQHNRSIYNSTFGTDNDTTHRQSQLTLLHMNRCGRGRVKTPTRQQVWLDYIAKINETVPEEIELNALYMAVLENPELVVKSLHEYGKQPTRRPRTSIIFSKSPSPEVILPCLMEDPSLFKLHNDVVERAIVPRKSTCSASSNLVPEDQARLFLKDRLRGLEDRERALALREKELGNRFREIQLRERRLQQREKDSESALVTTKPSSRALSKGHEKKAQRLSNGNKEAAIPSKTDPVSSPHTDSLAWDPFILLEERALATLEQFRDDCWAIATIPGNLFR